jgi:hypothetical protein
MAATLPRVIFALVAVALVAWLVISRSNELFVLSFRDGEVRLVRGAVATGLRTDLRDALQHMKVKRATVRVTKTPQGARLTASGVDEFGEQRLRNILQLFPAARLRSTQAPSQNRLLRLFGFSALVWLLGSRDE